MGPLFKYTYQNLAGQYEYVDGGTIQTSPTPVYLTDDPDNWYGMQVSFDRDEDKGGVFRKSTVALRFHSDAKKIIQHEFLTKHIRGYKKVTIYKQNRGLNDGNWNYSLWYSCEVDFGTAVQGGVESEDPKDSVYFSARFIELGVPALLEANEATDYEFPVDSSDPDAIPVRIGNISAKGRYSYILPRTVDINGNDTFIPGTAFASPVIFTQENIIYRLGDARSTDENLIVNTTGTFFQDSYAFSGRLKSSPTIQYINVAGSSSFDVKIRVTLRKLDASLALISNTILYTDTTGLAVGAPVRTRSFDIDEPVSMTNGEQFVLVVDYINASTGATVTAGQVAPEFRYHLQDWDFFLDVVFKMPETIMYGFRYTTLIGKVVDKMTNGIGSFYSDAMNANAYLYDNKPYNDIIIPGSSVRDLDEKKIKINFKDIRQDLKMAYGYGVGINSNVVRVEPLPYFYDKTVITCTIADNGPIKVSTATDFIYNKIKVGNSNSLVDDINGLDEFCCEHDYDCGLISPTVSTKELDLTSKVISGMYSMETARSYRFRSDTDSTTKDNENFVVQIEDAPVDTAYNPYRNPSTVNTGINFPDDAYNAGRSPLRCLMRYLPYIKSYLLDGDTVKFNKADKNSTFISGTPPLNYFIEAADIIINSTGASSSLNGYSATYANIERLFKPFYLESEAESPDNLLQIMAQTPNGLVQLDQKGSLAGSFVLDFGIQPGSQEILTYKGLASPDLDMDIFDI